MKTKKELNALKKEVEAVRGKLAELSEEELAQVTGGNDSDLEEHINIADRLRENTDGRVIYAGTQGIMSSVPGKGDPTNVWINISGNSEQKIKVEDAGEYSVNYAVISEEK